MSLVFNTYDPCFADTVDDPLVAGSRVKMASKPRVQGSQRLNSQYFCH